MYRDKLCRRFVLHHAGKLQEQKKKEREREKVGGIHRFNHP